MGKKRTIEKSTDELMAEREAVDSAVKSSGDRVKKPKKGITRAEAHILSTWNNTIISITNLQGDVVAQSSAGAIGFKGSKKSTPFAASRVAEAVAEKAKSLGISRVAVTVKGIGAGRESAVRALASHGLDVITIRDRTPIPHNGPRARKPRRV